MRKGTAERRLQILGAAITCFIKQGYHPTGMREVATQAGVSLGNVYNHFAGKEEILATIAGLEAEELAVFVSQLRGEGDPELRLEHFVADYTAYSGLLDNALLSLEIVAAAAREPKIAALFLGNRQELVEALAALVGELRQTADGLAAREEVARLLLDTIEGQAIRMVIGGRKPNQAEMSTLQHFALAAASGGVIADEPSQRAR